LTLKIGLADVVLHLPDNLTVNFYLGIAHSLNQCFHYFDKYENLAIEENEIIIDQKPQVDKMINKLLAYRVFADEQGKMNLSVADINGGVLVVSQFTLVADTKSGHRYSMTLAYPHQKHHWRLLHG
jgi:hypothetical protein